MNVGFGLVANLLADCRAEMKITGPGKILMNRVLSLIEQ